MTQDVQASIEIGHGDLFTGHMVMATWLEPTGWSAPELRPLAAISMHPATLGVHYAQTIFEGLKAYRRMDGSIAAFRPRDNARRFHRSADRLAMPPVPESIFLRAITDLVTADASWLPDNPEVSLYLRPLMVASEPTLMLRPAREYLFLVMAFVAGGFFGQPLAPVSVWVDHEHSRAMPGGTGDVKCAANYGPSFVAQQRAAEAGCQQVIWLDAVERRWVEEMGGMNLFVVYGDRVVTPALTGTLLPGITRDSLLVLSDRLGYRPSEEPVSLDRLLSDCRDGSVTELFACGTAAVVTPVGRIRAADGEWTVGDGLAGPVTRALRSALLDIQHGVAPDPNGWMYPICPAEPNVEERQWN